MNAPPGGAPKPSPELWNELEAAGAEAAHQGVPYETHPRWMAARARYLTALHDAGIEGHPDPLHGHAPTEVDDEERDDLDLPAFPMTQKNNWLRDVLHEGDD